MNAIDSQLWSHAGALRTGWQIFADHLSNPRTEKMSVSGAEAPMLISQSQFQIGTTGGQMLRKTLSIAILAMSTCALAQQSYQQYGSNRYYEDGENSQTINNNTYYSDGTTAQRVGNTTNWSDGQSAQQIGNNTYYNNGTTAQRIGNSTYYSNGTTCQQIGNQTFCN